MFVVCLVVLVGMLVIPSLKSSNYNGQWNKQTPQEKWQYYLAELRKYNWDTFEFGKTAARTWNYDQMIEALDKLEQGIFPMDDYGTDQDGRIEAQSQQTFTVYNVEEYIQQRYSYERKFGAVKRYPTRIQRFFDMEDRENFRQGKVKIDGNLMTIAEARTYCYDKVTAQMGKIYGFKMEK